MGISGTPLQNHPAPDAQGQREEEAGRMGLGLTVVGTMMLAALGAGYSVLVAWLW